MAPFLFLFHSLFSMRKCWLEGIGYYVNQLLHLMFHILLLKLILREGHIFLLLCDDVLRVWEICRVQDFRNQRLKCKGLGQCILCSCTRHRVFYVPDIHICFCLLVHTAVRLAFGSIVQYCSPITYNFCMFYFVTFFNCIYIVFDVSVIFPKSSEKYVNWFYMQTWFGSTPFNWEHPCTGYDLKMKIRFMVHL